MERSRTPQTAAVRANRRRLLQASAALAGTSLLGVRPRPAAARQEPVTLKMISLSDWPPHWAPVVEAFQARHPNITIEHEVYPFRQLFEIIEVRMQGQSEDVDLMAVDVPLVASYSLRGYLKPLDEYFSAEELASRWVPSSGEAGRHDGKLMAAPLNTSAQYMYVNLGLFREAGIEPPPALTADHETTVDEVVAGRWTWEQVVDAAKAMTADTNGDGTPDVWGFSFDQVSRPYQILALPESLEQPSISEDGLTTAGYLDSPKWIQAATFYHDLFNGQPVSPKGVTPTDTPDLFATGKAAIWVGGEWNARRFSEAEGLEFGIAAHPYFANGRVATPTGSWHIGIPAFSQHPAEAGQFIQFVTADPEGSRLWFEHHVQFPATVPLLEEIETAETYGQFPASGWRLAATEARTSAVPRPKTPGYLEFEDILATTLEDIRNGAQPAEALPGAVRRIDRALARYK